MLVIYMQGKYALTGNGPFCESTVFLQQLPLLYQVSRYAVRV